MRTLNGDLALSGAQRFSGMAGVYLLVDDSEILYVGSSRNVPRRIAYHSRQRIGYHRVFVVYTESYRELERLLIAAHKPKFNTVVNSVTGHAVIECRKIPGVDVDSLLAMVHADDLALSAL